MWPALSVIISLADGDMDFNPDDVTPGVIGFAATAVFAVAVILIGMSLYRRVRRMNYRAEVLADIERELAEGSGSAAGSESAGASGAAEDQDPNEDKTDL